MSDIAIQIKPDRAKGPTVRAKRSKGDGAPPPPAEWTPDRTFAAYIGSLVRRRMLVALMILASLLVALVYLKVAPAQFTSTALVLIDERSNAPLQFSSTVNDPTTVSANIESQVEIIKSSRTMQLLLEDQHLVDDPALQSDLFSRYLSTPLAKATSWMRPASPVGFHDHQLIAASVALQKLVDVHRLGTTFLIEVSATMSDPIQAASVTNSIVRIYMADQRRRREELARHQSALLQARSDELENRVRTSEEAVEELKYSGSLSGENSAAAQVKLKDLESLAHTYRVLHDKFLEQSAASWQQQFLSLPDATVASAAYPPLQKTSPRVLLVLAVALLVGISLASVIILVLDRKVLGLELRRGHA